MLADHDVKQPARTRVFAAAVQKKNRQHGQRDWEKHGFQKNNAMQYRAGDGKVVNGHFHESGKAAQQENVEWFTNIRFPS